MPPLPPAVEYDATATPGVTERGGRKKAGGGSKGRGRARHFCDRESIRGWVGDIIKNLTRWSILDLLSYVTYVTYACWRVYSLSYTIADVYRQRKSLPLPSRREAMTPFFCVFSIRKSIPFSRNGAATWKTWTTSGSAGAKRKRELQEAATKDWKWLLWESGIARRRAHATKARGGGLLRVAEDG